MAQKDSRAGAMGSVFAMAKLSRQLETAGGFRCAREGVQDGFADIFPGKEAVIDGRQALFFPGGHALLSDLDGTLLTRESVLPEGAAEKIRALCDHGVHLTYATARTIRSAAYILAGYRTRLPFRS